MCCTGSMTKNCCRCGQDFIQKARETICQGCRKKPDPPTGLSFRENQIVELIKAAKQNKEIAYELHLSEGTIKEYLNRIFRKLGLHSRTELAMWAVNRDTTDRVR